MIVKQFHHRGRTSHGRVARFRKRMFFAPTILLQHKWSCLPALSVNGFGNFQCRPARGQRAAMDCRLYRPSKGLMRVGEQWMGPGWSIQTWPSIHSRDKTRTSHQPSQFARRQFLCGRKLAVANGPFQGFTQTRPGKILHRQNDEKASCAVVNELSMAGDLGRPCGYGLVRPPMKGDGDLFALDGLPGKTRAVFRDWDGVVRLALSRLPVSR